MLLGAYIATSVLERFDGGGPVLGLDAVAADDIVVTFRRQRRILGWSGEDCGLFAVCSGYSGVCVWCVVLVLGAPKDTVVPGFTGILVYTLYAVRSL
jgi:hypothetical protein